MSMAAASFVLSHPPLQFRSNLMSLESYPVACLWRPPLLKVSPTLKSWPSWSINCSVNRSEASSSSPVSDNYEPMPFPDDGDKKRMRSKNKQAKKKRMAQSASVQNSSKSGDKLNEEDEMTLLRKKMLGDLDLYKWTEPEGPLPYT